MKPGSNAAVSHRKPTAVTSRRLDASEVALGKDLLELLTTAMYADPMTIYREYVQNAADSIDQARRTGIMTADELGRVEIDVDPVSRTVSVQDNGTGVPFADFAPRLAALGGSVKRGSGVRGFRGVGRLAGLGYAQELIFRTRATGEDEVSEMRWDCRKLRALMRTQEFSDLQTLVSQIVTVSRVEAADWPERFFQVQMAGVVRMKADRLMDPSAIAGYLAQVAPVPFHPGFRLGPAIVERLDGLVSLGNIDLRVSGRSDPVYRPFGNRFQLDDNTFSEFSGVEFFELRGGEGGVAGIAWVLHHDYAGAIPTANLIKGLRMRSGNIQVGHGALLDELFSEPRFNSWSVGEVHVVDSKVVPNGRRDDFEQNAHLVNLTNQLIPVAQELSHRCRTGSVRRKLLKEFDLHATAGTERLSIIEQGVVDPVRRSRLLVEARDDLAKLRKISASQTLFPDDRMAIDPRIEAFGTRLVGADDHTNAVTALPSVTGEKRQAYEEIFGLIYECSSNRSIAKSLIDRILEKIG